jgi:hypothetical protein
MKLMAEIETATSTCKTAIKVILTSSVGVSVLLISPEISFRTFSILRTNFENSPKPTPLALWVEKIQEGLQKPNNRCIPISYFICPGPPIMLPASG